VKAVAAFLQLDRILFRLELLEREMVFKDDLFSLYMSVMSKIRLAPNNALNKSIQTIVFSNQR